MKMKTQKIEDDNLVRLNDLFDKISNKGNYILRECKGLFKPCIYHKL